MSNYTRNTLSGDLSPVNAELEKVQKAIADKFDRNPSLGQANQLTGVLDANSQRIINLPPATEDNDVARLVDLTSIVDPVVTSIASVDASVIEATNQAGIATTQAGLATTQVTLATDQVVLATAQADASEVSALASAVSALDSAANALGAFVVIPQTTPGTLTALATNELRSAGTFTLPLASSIAANGTIRISLPVEYGTLAPVVQRDGADTITGAGGATDTSLTFVGATTIELTSDGVSDWGL